VIEPTDEMVAAYVEAWRGRLFKPPQDTERPAVRAGLAAVLALVKRDQAGPCSETLPRLTEYGDLWCQLRHGHLGDHEMGPTRWKTRTPPQ
jgi:hypothetical protein